MISLLKKSVIYEYMKNYSIYAEKIKTSVEIVKKI